MSPRGAGTARRRIAAPAAAAGAAALGHALFARLLCSPYDWSGDELAEARQYLAHAQRAAVEPALVAAFARLAPAIDGAQAQRDALAAQYSALFEVGTAGPPLPIREELTASAAGGAKEEVVRFYDLFGYTLDARHAWAPDHLAVMLEFLGWLAGHESAAAAGDLQSLRLAQRDFIDQHLMHWLPSLALAVRSWDELGFHARAFDALELALRSERTRLETARED